MGLFLWPHGADTAACLHFRRPTGDEVRGVNEIALPELVVLAREVGGEGLEGEEALTAMARRAGLKKLRKASRGRLEMALRRSTAPASDEI